VKATDLVTHLLHGLFMSLWYATLMVTQNGNLSVGIVVSVELLLEGGIFEVILVQKLLKRNRSVECTENLGCQAFHFVVEMLVQ
jgi:hypothetical protein